MIKKELIVALKGEHYFVKVIINPEEDDFKPEVIFGRSFLRLAQGVVDFGNGVITIYPKPDLFEEESEKTRKSLDDWDQLLDFNFNDVSKSGEELPLFVCKIGKSNRNKKRAVENLNLFYQDVRPSSLVGRHLTPVIETMAYNDKNKKILDEICKDKVELDGKIVKEDEEAVKRIKGEALEEKDDPGAFIFPIRLEGKGNESALADTGSDINIMPYRIFETLGREDMKKVDRGITMINHTQAEAMGKLSNVLCQVGVTTIITKFLILDIPIDRDAPIVIGRRFLHMIGSILNASERIFSTFDGVCHQTFRAARFDVLRTTKSDSNDEEDYVIKRNKSGAPIYGPRPAPYLNCTNPEDRSSVIQAEHMMEKPDHHDPNAQDNTKLWKRYCFYKCTTKDVPEMQSLEIDDMLRIRVSDVASEEEFYSTYAFDEVCDNAELQTKKIIKFRLGGRAHNLTLLEFARRLGLYQAIELEEDGFNVYFEGGWCNDENFNASDYWLSISREENLSLSRSHTSTIKSPILRVIHKMITYGLCQRTTGYDKVQKNDLWLLSMFDARHQNGYANVAWVIARCMKRKGAGTQKESHIYYVQFISKLARKCMVLIEDVDLYDMIGRMEICQDAIERMEYRQSYHWDIYHGVFKHMAGVYSVPLQGAYNPPGYAQPQYDQYYQQYPPTPPQQQHDTSSVEMTR
ncbi:putative reverse transcriptase, RNA-dependent DNA polymerase, partial [Tanacetum coccineum]